MGESEYTCFNSPNCWRLGWCSPLATVEGRSLSHPRNFTIATQITTQASFVQISMGSVSAGAPTVFISYR